VPVSSLNCFDHLVVADEGAVKHAGGRAGSLRVESLAPVWRKPAYAGVADARFGVAGVGAISAEIEDKTRKRKEQLMFPSNLETAPFQLP